MQLFTFRTNSFQNQLRSIDSDLFVSLKADLEKIKKRGLVKHLASVVGVAMTSGPPTVKPTTLNQLGQLNELIVG